MDEDTGATCFRPKTTFDTLPKSNQKPQAENPQDVETASAQMQTSVAERIKFYERKIHEEWQKAQTSKRPSARAPMHSNQKVQMGKRSDQKLDSGTVQLQESSQQEMCQRLRIMSHHKLEGCEKRQHELETSLKDVWKQVESLRWDAFSEDSKQESEDVSAYKAVSKSHEFEKKEETSRESGDAASSSETGQQKMHSIWGQVKDHFTESAELCHFRLDVSNKDFTYNSSEPVLNEADLRISQEISNSMEEIEHLPSSTVHEKSHADDLEAEISSDSDQAFREIEEELNLDEPQERTSPETDTILEPDRRSFNGDAYLQELDSLYEEILCDKEKFPPMLMTQNIPRAEILGQRSVLGELSNCVAPLEISDLHGPPYTLDPVSATLRYTVPDNRGAEELSGVREDWQDSVRLGTIMIS